MKAKLYAIFAVLALFGMGVWAETPVDTGDDHDLTRSEARALERGDEILAALQSFYAQNGFYPETLDELVPQYIGQIPKSGLNAVKFQRNVPFEYEAEPRKYRPGYFRLRFLNSGDSQYWEYDSRADSIVKTTEGGQHVSGCKIQDVVKPEDIMALANAVNSYFAEHKVFPETLEELVSAYLDKLPDCMVVRFSYKGEVLADKLAYIVHQPLKDDEPEMPQTFWLGVRYKSECIYYYRPENKMWKFIRTRWWGPQKG